MIRTIKDIGPGALVAAAFIGPGTVTACTIAGATYGFSLIWVLVLATVFTIALQNMIARLGVVTQKGLGDALAQSSHGTIWRWPMVTLTVLALYVGNVAYEGGNLAGAGMGVSLVIAEGIDQRWVSVFIAFVASAFFLLGSYKVIEKLLIVVVLFMSCAFFITFAVVGVDFSEFFKGAMLPTIPGGAIFTVVALFGTTIVPYNLFLHASAAKSRWKSTGDLAVAKVDTRISVGLGGMISIMILSTAAATFFQSGIQVNSSAEMALQLEPAFGSYAKYLLAGGLVGAGLSSAITAPMATAYAVSEILGFDSRINSWPYRCIALSVLITGTGFTLVGIRPINLIVLAQFANGLILPIVVGFVLVTMNKKKILGKFVNTRLDNILGIALLLLTLILGIRLILSAVGFQL